MLVSLFSRLEPLFLLVLYFLLGSHTHIGIPHFAGIREEDTEHEAQDLCGKLSAIFVVLIGYHITDLEFDVPGAPVKEIYFLALIDVLTHYGVKKQAAKAAKTVKYGGNVDGISTCDPEQYGKRFIEFISKAIG